MGVNLGGLTPLFLSTISAGFPQTADDQVESPLDLNEYMIKHPSATYFVRVVGDSMIGVGIQKGDILVVDRSLIPVDGSIVVAAIDGEFTVKRLRISFGQKSLVSENPSIKRIVFDASAFEDGLFEVWGVVTHSIGHHT